MQDLSPLHLQHLRQSSPHSRSILHSRHLSRSKSPHLHLPDSREQADSQDLSPLQLRLPRMSPCSRLIQHSRHPSRSKSPLLHLPDSREQADLQDLSPLQQQHLPTVFRDRLLHLQLLLQQAYPSLPRIHPADS